MIPGSCSAPLREPRAQLIGGVVEAVGIEPTSGNPQPQASTPISGLSYVSLALQPSIRQEDREASLNVLAPPLRPGSEPATGVWRPFPDPVGPIRRTLAGVRPPELAGCWQLYRSLYLTRGEKPRDAAWTSLIPVETFRPLVRSLIFKSTTARAALRARPCPSHDAPRAPAAPRACRGASSPGPAPPRASRGRS
jgi:hypothetical protein